MGNSNPAPFSVGGKAIGICGGLQMLGQHIHDPNALEGAAGSSTGLAFFDMVTTLETDKVLRNTVGTLALNNAAVTGYEIHAGITTYHTAYNPAVFVHMDLMALSVKTG